MKKPILVTGSHRSGSTWIGKTISESKEVGYVHEPFNIGISRFNPPFTHFFEFISEFCGEAHQNQTKKYLESFCDFPSAKAWGRIFNIRSIKDIYFCGEDLFNFKRRFQQRTLFKDPIALMSAEWLYKELNCDVIITVRHPAAFIASLKVKGWEFDFNNFLDQKNLMRVHLSAYQKEIEEYTLKQPGIVEQGIVLWNCIYATVAKFQEQYGNKWYVVKHEDLSISPEEEFAKIFEYLNIEFTDQVRQSISESTTAKDGSKLKRDSLKNLKTWQDRLSQDEISLIKKETQEVWQKFYSEEDWS